jgi:hypothetical protein
VTSIFRLPNDSITYTRPALFGSLIGGGNEEGIISYGGAHYVITIQIKTPPTDVIGSDADAIISGVYSLYSEDGREMVATGTLLGQLMYDSVSQIRSDLRLVLFGKRHIDTLYRRTEGRYTNTGGWLVTYLSENCATCPGYVHALLMQRPVASGVRVEWFDPDDGVRRVEFKDDPIDRSVQTVNTGVEAPPTEQIDSWQLSGAQLDTITAAFKIGSDEFEFRGIRYWPSSLPYGGLNGTVWQLPEHRFRGYFVTGR